jgi:hypothetical protein
MPSCGMLTGCVNRRGVPMPVGVVTSLKLGVLVGQRLVPYLQATKGIVRVFLLLSLFGKQIGYSLSI